MNATSATLYLVVSALQPTGDDSRRAILDAAAVVLPGELGALAKRAAQALELAYQTQAELCRKLGDELSGQTSLGLSTDASPSVADLPDWQAVKSKILGKYKTLLDFATVLGCHPNALQMATQGKCPEVLKKMMARLSD